MKANNRSSGRHTDPPLSSLPIDIKVTKGIAINKLLNNIYVLFHI